MKTECKYNWHGTGRQVFYDKTTFETLTANFPIDFKDDFFGADVDFPASGSVESGCKWSKKIVGVCFSGRSK